MNLSRDTRRNALQALYQFDCGSSTDDEHVRSSLDCSTDDDSGIPGGIGEEADRQQGYELAQSIWLRKDEADEQVAALTPEWPIHRQPIIDRNVLRMGWYEIVSECTPPKVAINEAIELAREYSTTQSPLFVNGVLDKIYHDLRAEPVDDAPEIILESTTESATESASESATEPASESATEPTTESTPESSLGTDVEH
ncbi:MAG: transcription antitermination factor NusB [Phycisphaerales bacterium]|nr:transcription antitermination factor NusB [Phycisphaerales bacterium]